MTSIKKFATLFLFLTIPLVAGGCHGNSNGTPTNNPTNGTSLPPLSGSNVMQMTVNGSLCASGSYPNKPCVSVTICSTTNSNCQTINDILLDTGSFGLRIFSSVLNSNLNLTPVTIGGKTLAECPQFGDGSSLWGPLETANIVLGGEPAVQTSIQVVNSSFVGESSNCNGSYASPSDAGYNGILGVGVFAQDCGSGCSGNSSNGMYFTCNGSNCTGYGALTTQQLQNPVSLLPHDNNGVLVELPSVPLGGVAYANGYVVLGINTETNNVPFNVAEYTTDGEGSFITNLNGDIYNDSDAGNVSLSNSSFLDTGSNGIFFSSPSGVNLPDCSNYDSNFAGWFCPSSTQSLTATTSSFTTSSSVLVPFSVGNAIDLSQTFNNVFVEMGGDGGGNFDWGLPFFMGRNVFVGIENTSSNIGTGPYWGY